MRAEDDVVGPEFFRLLEDVRHDRAEALDGLHREDLGRQPFLQQHEPGRRALFALLRQRHQGVRPEAIPAGDQGWRDAVEQDHAGAQGPGEGGGGFTNAVGDRGKIHWGEDRFHGIGGLAQFIGSTLRRKEREQNAGEVSGVHPDPAAALIQKVLGRLRGAKSGVSFGMKNTLKTTLLPVAVALGLTAAGLLQSGCVGLLAGAAAGAGTMAYVRGELDATLDQNYDQAVLAAGRAIDTLQFAKVSEQRDALNAILIARTAEDKKVEIKVTKTSDQLTTVAIRVGVFGDEAVARLVLEKIQGHR